jgi:hypothetical protein
MDLQNQYCRNGYTTKSNLYIQCNPYENSNDILHRDRKVNPKVNMDAQKTMNTPNNPEIEKQHWRDNNTQFQTVKIVKTAILLAKKQT